MPFAGSYGGKRGSSHGEVGVSEPPEGDFHEDYVAWLLAKMLKERRLGQSRGWHGIHRCQVCNG